MHEKRNAVHAGVPEANQGKGELLLWGTKNKGFQENDTFDLQLISNKKCYILRNLKSNKNCRMKSVEFEVQ